MKWTMHKTVQEGDAQKLTKLMILMTLLQFVSLDNISDVQGFPTSTYTQKGRHHYLYKNQVRPGVRPSH